MFAEPDTCGVTLRSRRLPLVEASSEMPRLTDPAPVDDAEVEDA